MNQVKYALKVVTKQLRKHFQSCFGSGHPQRRTIVKKIVRRSMDKTLNFKKTQVGQ
jgi:hypothetical protein